VTRQNTLTEDGLNADISEQLIDELKKIIHKSLQQEIILN
jgi:hypothetical protein